MQLSPSLVLALSRASHIAVCAIKIPLWPRSHYRKNGITRPSPPKEGTCSPCELGTTH